MNKAAADTFRRLGQDPQTMIGKSVWELFPEVRGTVVERELRKALEDHASIKFEFLYPGDRRSYEIQGYPLARGHLGFSGCHGPENLTQVVLRASSQRSLF